MPQSEETKIALTQQKVSDIERNVNRILDNHLPHIQAEVVNVNEKIDTKIEEVAKRIDDKTGEMQAKMDLNFVSINKQISDLRVTVAKYGAYAVGAISVIEVVLKFIPTR